MAIMSFTVIRRIFIRMRKLITGNILRNQRIEWLYKHGKKTFYKRAYGGRYNWFDKQAMRYYLRKINNSTAFEYGSKFVP